jgi:hypothetical protein
MNLRGVINQRAIELITDNFSTALVIVVLILIRVLISYMRTIFFPSGDLTIDIIIILDDVYTIFLMLQQVITVLIKGFVEIFRMVNKITHIRKLQN